MQELSPLARKGRVTALFLKRRTLRHTLVLRMHKPFHIKELKELSVAFFRQLIELPKSGFLVLFISLEISQLIVQD